MEPLREALKAASEHRRCGPRYEGCYSHLPIPHCRACGMAVPCDTERLASALAVPDPLRLDPDDPASVEQLARALHATGLNTIGKKPGGHGPYTQKCICWMDARIIARAWKETA